MPEISRFYGIVIAMFYNDHTPPHFHARYGDQRAIISIDTLTVLRGRLSPRLLGLVTEWAALHQEVAGELATGAPAGAAEGHCTAAVKGMKMMVDVVEARPLGGHRLHLRFEDGVEGEIDLAELIRFEGVFAPLQDPARFAEVKVHPELGTVCWPDGADLDPDVLYGRITGTPILPEIDAHSAH